MRYKMRKKGMHNMAELVPRLMPSKAELASYYWDESRRTRSSDPRELMSTTHSHKVRPSKVIKNVVVFRFKHLPLGNQIFPDDERLLAHRALDFPVIGTSSEKVFLYVCLRCFLNPSNVKCMVLALYCHLLSSEQLHLI